MAEMTIRLQIDPQTGKKNVVISLKSDEDALPHEHEQKHRSLVDKLIAKGLLTASELGEIVVEREVEVEAECDEALPTQQQERRQQPASE